jgi:hypothetical protein
VNGVAIATDNIAKKINALMDKLDIKYLKK